ncbi:MAG: NYN domain-containing protein [Proteobacteria bacterium]|nr:NYN domain-containing protein [Pseudomonadota bacterium]
MAIFIDGGYLEKILKNEFREVAIDFKKLSSVLAGQKEILRAYYYNCLPYQSNTPSREESDRFANKERFFSYLRGLPRFTVKLGKLAFRGCDNKGKKTFEQKGIDTLLSIDLVNLAATKQVSDIILLAGDSDYIPAIEVAKTHGVGVILYHSQKKDSYHRSLWEVCDERYPITSGFINKIKRTTR